MQTQELTIRKHAPGTVSLEDMNADGVRTHVREMTRDFRSAWRNLAQAIQAVKENKLYLKWGYETFDNYITKEVGIRMNTAVKLIRSYMFLKKEGPHYLKVNAPGKDHNDLSPTFEAVSTLQRAKKSLDENDYRQVKKELLDEGRDVQAVKKDLTVLIRNRRKDIDPEEERKRRGKESVKRYLSSLKAFRCEIEMLHILPPNFALEISQLVDKIEACLEGGQADI